ncbi:MULTISPECIES: GNAT family N-acetyltransferase [Winogradskyella]|uniref:GNAT family N-acetyltransferase n=1 Tax=Winogradskyella ouciana TaxID=2608631 RepID=A0A7K1G7P3_9FLAO|nr:MULTISPECIES: GNAT family N-acetyltransferase [Winogradskyella]MBO6881923.1 GNAT family N-acetyltransferase [Winogradskyella sp.]MTE25306.1 GNAT family N-acetyltransferase [Winogradskyella ouciana]
MNIIKAHIDHLEDLVPLFNSYRIFYKQASDEVGARQFLIKRFKNQDSIIFMAYIDSKAVGFIQLYPLLSSVSIQPMFLLNDLFIDANYRGQGIGEALINKAKQLCISQNNKGLAIQTAHDNPAQNLYKRLGFEADTDLHFFWTNR